jgi:hypothetical protein
MPSNLNEHAGRGTRGELKIKRWSAIFTPLSHPS